MEIDVKVDDHGLGRKFLLSKKQIAFAEARAINETLMKAQTVQQRFMQRKFTIRKKGLLKATVRMLRFAKASSLKGVLGINPQLMHIWGLHETGGEEKPRSSRYVAVPMDIRRGKSGTITKSNRPRNLKRSFVITTKGKKRIYQRKGKGKRSTIRPVYQLEPSVTIHKALFFVSNVVKSINKNYKKEMIKAVRKELERIGVKLST